MNKFKLLVAPLLVLPFIAACNNGGGDKPEEVKFSLSSGWPIEVVDKTATVYVDWTPNDIIKFDSFTFTASPAKENTVTFDQTGDPRPMPVTITFKEDITTDISGTLSFKYEDVTAKTKGEGKLNVTIPKPEFDPIVTQDEFDHAVNFDGIKRMQVYGDEHIIEDGDTCDMTTSEETSEYIYHHLSIQNMLGIESKNEVCTRIKNIGDESCEFTMNQNDSGWSTPGTTTSKKFGFTSDYHNPLKKLEKEYEGFEPSLEYEHFSFTDDKYIYKGTAKEKAYSTETSISLTLNFKNKILVSCSNTIVEGDITVQSEISYKFEDKVPTWPFPNF